MKSIYEVEASNDAADSGNLIHTDEVASQYGFAGGLVSGAVLFGYMSYLPVKAQGRDWFTDNRVDLKLVQPAYDGEVLTIEHEEADDGAGETLCINSVRDTLATMASHHGRFPVAATSEIAPATHVEPRVEIDWKNLFTDKPAPAHIWHADPAHNLALATEIHDDHGLYRGENAVVHPSWILRQCNAAFERSFILPAWLHVGSSITFHKPLRLGEEIETRMVPTHKWEKKGHQFTTLAIPFIVAGEVRVEVEHTVIFRIAPPDAGL